MGTLERMTSWKGSSEWGVRSTKRDAMMVYWVERGVERECAWAWWGVYSPDWQRIS